MCDSGTGPWLGMFSHILLIPALTGNVLFLFFRMNEAFLYCQRCREVVGVDAVVLFDQKTSSLNQGPNLALCFVLGCYVIKCFHVPIYYQDIKRCYSVLLQLYIIQYRVNESQHRKRERGNPLPFCELASQMARSQPINNSFCSWCLSPSVSLSLTLTPTLCRLIHPPCYSRLVCSPFMKHLWSSGIHSPCLQLEAYIFGEPNQSQGNRLPERKDAQKVKRKI